MRAEWVLNTFKFYFLLWTLYTRSRLKTRMPFSMWGYFHFFLWLTIYSCLSRQEKSCPFSHSRPNAELQGLLVWDNPSLQELPMSLASSLPSDTICVLFQVASWPVKAIKDVSTVTNLTTETTKDRKKSISLLPLQRKEPRSNLYTHPRLQDTTQHFLQASYLPVFMDQS